MAVENDIRCSVDGCINEANRKGHVLCEKHYMRLRRHGNTDKLLPKIGSTSIHSHGYLLEYAPGHPLAEVSNTVYQHRRIAYDHYGSGPFQCHWCSHPITWGTLHVDHLDDDKKNNSVTNLALSCAICNQQRGRHKMIGTYRDRFGITLNGITLTLNEWARKMGMARSSIKSRIDKGWSIEDAILTPRGNYGPRR